MSGSPRSEYWGPCDVAEDTTLATVIDQLFTTIKKAPDEEYSMRGVARWCHQWLADRGGGTFSSEYMRQLRNGMATNPTKLHLEALAAFFEVDPVIFFVNSERSQAIRAELDLVAAIRDSGVKALALRAADLNADQRRKLAQYIARLPSRADGQA